MTPRKNRRCHGESGAALVLAIAFLVLMSGIGAAVVSSITSGVTGRAVLDQVRNRQYAADGAIEKSIARVRTTGGICGAQDLPFPLDGATIHVDCSPVPSFIVQPDSTIATQNNIVFTACLSTGNPCTASSTIINAQVNFQGTTSPLTTYVQSWSVNG